MSSPSILIIDPDEARRSRLSEQIRAHTGCSVTAVDDPLPITDGSHDILLVSESSRSAIPDLLESHPASPLIFISDQPRPSNPASTDSLEGVFTVLHSQAAPEEVLAAVQRAVNTRLRLETWSANRAAGDLFPTKPDGILMVDPEGHVQYLNDAAQTFFKIPPHGWESTSLQELIDLPEFTDSIFPLSGEPKDPFIIQPSGSEPHIVQTARIEGIGTIATLHNIASYKEVETLRTELIQMISHDLRSPLTAILGYVELISRVGPVTPEQQEFVRRARISVNVITQFIDSLLELSRIDADTTQVRGAASLPLILSECQIALQPLFDEKNQTIEIQVAQNLPHVHGRTDRLRQMVINLLENANKYTEEGGRVTMRARREGDQVLLEVQDDGIGIPPSDIPFIFEKMYRGKNTPVEAPGSGLGLAIVKSIVENHGGRLWCESSVGQGTIFTILLPAVPGDDGSGTPG